MGRRLTHSPLLPSFSFSPHPNKPTPPNNTTTTHTQTWAAAEASDADACEEMTIEEILTGKGDYFLGLIPLCNMYLDYIG